MRRCAPKAEHKGFHMFIRRLGEEAITACANGHSCSQILETSDRDVAVVGKVITAEARVSIPPGPGVGLDEGVVRIPRSIFLAAAREILKSE
jgi:hypothetical protein